MRTYHLLVLLFFVCSIGIRAQSAVGSGAVSGTVRDANGDGIPDANVVLSNDALSVHRVMVSSMDGVFDATGVLPSPGYRLKVTRKSFAPWEGAVFEIVVGQKLDFDIPLSSEATAAKAETDSSEPLVDNIKVAVGTAITPQQLDDLPIRSRRWDDLELLAPQSIHRVTGLAKIDYRRSDRNTVSLEAGFLRELAIQ